MIRHLTHRTGSCGEFFLLSDIVYSLHIGSDLPGKLTVARSTPVDNSALAAVEHHCGLSTGTPTIDLESREKCQKNLAKNIETLNLDWIIPLFVQH